MVDDGSPTMIFFLRRCQYKRGSSKNCCPFVFSGSGRALRASRRATQIVQGVVPGGYLEAAGAGACSFLTFSYSSDASLRIENGRPDFSTASSRTLASHLRPRS